MTTISLKLPNSLRRDLEREAAARGLSKSVVIRESLEKSLRAGKKKRKVSCLDLMHDLAGAFDGPPDLSANKKKYLEKAIQEDEERKRRDC